MKNLHMFLLSKVTLTRAHESVSFGSNESTEYRFSGTMKKLEILRKFLKLKFLN